MTELARWGTAATTRRVEALRARADHPSTPAPEAAACRELLAKLDVGVPDRCRSCQLIGKETPEWQARYERLRVAIYRHNCGFRCDA
jgi:hypothetical protein